MLPKVQVLACPITVATPTQLIDEVFRLAEMRKGSYVTFTNVHMLMEAQNNPQFARVVAEADMASPDGAPVALFMNKYYGLNQERMPGMAILPLLLEEAEHRGKSVFFYGGKQEVLDVITAKIKAQLPQLQVAGMHSPPFRPLTEAEKEAEGEMFALADADLIFVALGCPRQENWMAAHAGTVKGCMLGVGQAFLTFAGLEKRLPPTLRKLPVEWIYRLILEPRRLFKRYFFTNTQFMWLAAKAFAKK